MTHAKPGIVAAPLLLIALLSFGSVIDAEAAEAKPKAESANAPAQPTQEAKSADASGSRGGENAAKEEEEDFTPSEEISEDFAVSFPVNI